MTVPWNFHGSNGQVATVEFIIVCFVLPNFDKNKRKIDLLLFHVCLVALGDLRLLEIKAMGPQGIVVFSFSISNHGNKGACDG